MGRRYRKDEYSDESSSSMSDTSGYNHDDDDDDDDSFERAWRRKKCCYNCCTLGMCCFVLVCITIGAGFLVNYFLFDFMGIWDSGPGAWNREQGTFFGGSDGTGDASSDASSDAGSDGSTSEEANREIPTIDPDSIGGDNNNNILRPTFAPVGSPSLRPTRRPRTRRPTSPPTLSYEDNVLNVLTDNLQNDNDDDPIRFGETILLINTTDNTTLLTSSPQYFAYQWLLQNDTLGKQTYYQQQQQQRLLQKFALLTLYYSTNGPSWFSQNNWLNGQIDHCQWQFVTCDDIYIYNNGTTTTTTTSSSTTTTTTTTTVPLQDLDLDDPTVSLTIHKQVITHLEFQNNNLHHGKIPNEIRFLSNSLKVFKIIHDLETSNTNGLYGPLPTVIGLLTNLETLILSGHSLSTNTIVTQRMNITDNDDNDDNDDNNDDSDDNNDIIEDSEQILVEEVIQQETTTTNVRITSPFGTLPSEIGSLSDTLKYMDLSHNQITGTIPNEISSLHQIVIIDLSYNELRGSIPPSIGEDIQSNVLVSPPDTTDIDTIPNDDSVIVEDQEQQDEQQQDEQEQPITKNSFLQVLNLSHNFLWGSISNNIGNLQRLKYLNLNNNVFTTLPTNLFWLASNLQILKLNNNILGGKTIPITISRLTSLQELSISNNAYIGTIPKSIFTLLTNLQVLDLSQNYLTGTIHTEIQSLSNLKNLMLDANYLSGRVPSALSADNLQQLQSIRIDKNRFTGTVPNAVCNSYEDVVIYSDCVREITCPCCQYCCADDALKCTCQFIDTDPLLCLASTLTEIDNDKFVDAIVETEFGN